VRAASRGLDIVGFYHSHPDHPAEPSRFDLDHAWPNVSYVIVSVRDRLPRELRSWRLRADRSGYHEESVLSGAV
jgi:proteasome lid subunit RPN8/RPN11